MPEADLLEVVPNGLSGAPIDSAVLPAAPGTSDERAARRDLRRQIASMERQLAGLFTSAFPRKGIEWGVEQPMWGPRLLDVAELEQLRDALAAHLSRVRAQLASRAHVEEQNRRELESMVEDPAAHRWELISNEDIGEPGCKHFHSRPRLGLIGMLMGWWRVKVSSGCPLAGGCGRGTAALRQHCRPRIAPTDRSQ